MRNVRIFFSQTGRMRFVSHLDMTRFFSRAIRRAKLPVWYTEGFHPHLYMNFALPLSLGHEAFYDAVDIRIMDEELSLSEVKNRLSAAMPPDLEILRVAEPLMKTGEIASADYRITFRDEGALRDPMKTFISSGPILVRKKTKRGEEKEIDLSEKLLAAEVTAENENTGLFLRLPAGPVDNVNPELLIAAFYESYPAFYSYRVMRTAISNGSGRPFE